MKKTVSFIISAVIAAAAAVPAVTASAVNVNSPVVQNLVGDINSDGSLAISDAVLLSGYLLGAEQFTEKQYKAADLNTDGDVNTYDFIVMRERVIADIRADVQQTGLSYRYDATSQITYDGCKKAISGLSAVITSSEDIQNQFGTVFQPCVISALTSFYDDSFFENNVLLINTELWDSKYYDPSGADISDENGVITITTHRQQVADDEVGIGIRAVIHQVSYPKDKYDGQEIVWCEEGAKKIEYKHKHFNEIQFSDFVVISSYDAYRRFVADSFRGYEDTDEQIDEQCLMMLNQSDDTDDSHYPEQTDTYHSQDDLKKFFEDHFICFKESDSLHYNYYSDTSAVVLRGNTLNIDYLDDPLTYGDQIMPIGEMFIFDKKDFDGIDPVDLWLRTNRCNPDKDDAIVVDGPGKGGYVDHTVYVFPVSVAGKSYISIDGDSVQFMPTHWYNYDHIADIEIAPGFEKELTESNFEITKEENYFTISFPINKNGDMFSETYIFPDLYGTR